MSLGTLCFRIAETQKNMWTIFFCFGLAPKGFVEGMRKYEDASDIYICLYQRFDYPDSTQEHMSMASNANK